MSLLSTGSLKTKSAANSVLVAHAPSVLADAFLCKLGFLRYRTTCLPTLYLCYIPIFRRTRVHFLLRHSQVISSAQTSAHVAEKPPDRHIFMGQKDFCLSVSSNISACRSLLRLFISAELWSLGPANMQDLQASPPTPHPILATRLLSPTATAHAASPRTTAPVRACTGRFLLLFSLQPSLLVRQTKDWFGGSACTRSLPLYDLFRQHTVMDVRVSDSTGRLRGMHTWHFVPPVRRCGTSLFGKLGYADVGPTLPADAHRNAFCAADAFCLRPPHSGIARLGPPP